MTLRLPAEWEQQLAIQLTLPKLSDSWYINTPEVEKDILKIASIISQTQLVWLISTEEKRILPMLSNLQANLSNIQIINAPANDIWSRDHGPIGMYRDGNPFFGDFQFNGWGLKFPADLDNQINNFLHQNQYLNQMQSLHFVLEGGSIETDGQGTLLTTEHCMLSPNRNAPLNKQQIEEYLKEYLGIHTILWLQHGHLIGDDTDAHIDTLARFCSEDTIAYTSCSDPHDPQYAGLKLMEQELINLNKFKLIPLPIPQAIYDTESNRLPANYSNFLITNKAVLVPTYNDPNDQLAIERLSKTFVDRKIIPIDSSNLIVGRGSIHCCTMQIPF